MPLLVDLGPQLIHGVFTPNVHAEHAGLVSAVFGLEPFVLLGIFALTVLAFLALWPVVRRREGKRREMAEMSASVASAQDRADAATDRADAAEEHAGELVRSNIELERFAYIAAHELKEPLRMVSGYTQLLARRYKGQLDPDADEFIQYAVDGANRLQQLIEDLLAYARVGKETEPSASVDMEQALQRCLADLSLKMEETNARVTHNELPTVRGDQRQLVRLLENLIGNAIKFRGEEPPEVHVWAERRDGDWLFGVSDNGIGVASEYVDKIFEIFERHRQSADDDSGTGIGLAICRKIVELHGGRIWAESELGSGTVINFTIPAGGMDDE